MGFNSSDPHRAASIILKFYNNLPKIIEIVNTYARIGLLPKKIPEQMSKLGGFNERDFGKFC